MTIVKLSARPLGTLRHTRKGWDFQGDAYVPDFISTGCVGRVAFVMDRRTLLDKGTYVSPGFRRAGLALRLWREAIAWKRPKRIVVSIQSASGARLVASLQREYPKLDWQVFDDREEAA